MKYFNELAMLLDQEQAFDKAQHEALLLQRSVRERTTLGVTWFPIAITNSELGRGDYLTITVSKNNHPEEGHRFRFGMPVALFSNHNPREDRLQGVVAFAGRDAMRISFRVDELPAWSRGGRLGVDLLFDENSYKEMHRALHEASLALTDKKQGNLVRQLLRETDVREPAPNPVYENGNLNPSQNKAIAHILDESPLSILHGPPGTGKTTTLVYAVQALLKQRPQQLLVVAPSNTAVDVLTERLDAAGVSVVRIGNPVKVSDHLQELTLDDRVDSHTSRKTIRTLEKQARTYIDMAHKYKRNFGKAEREQRKALFDEAHKIRKEVDQLLDYIVQDVLNRAQVITATLVGANHYTIRDRRYQTVIIDEAAQALEPACWIPILKADCVVLAGDHCQLPPTVKSNRQATGGLYHTLFEKSVAQHPAHVSMLEIQYRMNAQIMKYPSMAFYADRLQAAPTVAHWTLPGDGSPILFIDTAGAGFEETVVDHAISNKEEAHFLHKHLVSLVTNLGPPTGPAFPSIGIITPYRAQSLYLRDIIAQDERLRPYSRLLQVNTIDSFQGQEKDVIYISLTRSNAALQIGFLADTRRMNVAMTRARKKLIVIGDSSTIGQHDFYGGFLDYIDSLASHHNVWEWHNEG
ncbi:AAA domain-containing protein [Parapedobacter sp. 10938]|uniref:AAA domain-containing protein n=1 Tax=Parapedobacter flavus TaxID=3110225 RepID=UPI002DB7A5BB|nr:AAA domain-containing protein [Parapedobacter sp. 10938]MEC3878681.1 AAA domain-containing protein [Parapedobacter sp. 10938]